MYQARYGKKGLLIFVLPPAQACAKLTPAHSHWWIQANPGCRGTVRRSKWLALRYRMPAEAEVLSGLSRPSLGAPLLEDPAPSDPGQLLPNPSGPRGPASPIFPPLTSHCVDIVSGPVPVQIVAETTQTPVCLTLGPPLTIGTRNYLLRSFMDLGFLPRDPNKKAGTCASMRWP